MSVLDTRTSWTRLALALTLSLVGNAGMWSIIVILPAVQAEFGVDRATATVPYTLTMVGFALGIPYEHPLGHRGLTHSLPFALLAGVVAAALFFRGLGLLSQRWWCVAGLLVLGTASHGLLDAFTDAGLGVGFLVPFSNSRWFFPWRPLATSPLSVQAFFGGPALAILANEVIWVWLPLGAGLLLRRALSRTG